MRFAHLLLALAALTTFSAAQEPNYQTDFQVGPQYLSLTGSNFLRPIATPSHSLDTPLAPIPSLPEVGPSVENQTFISNPALENQADLFHIFYGYPMTPVVLLLGPGPSEVPESLDGGIIRVVTPQSLQRAGYGVSLGENATYWKSQVPGITRVYTNADVEGLREK